MQAEDWFSPDAVKSLGGGVKPTDGAVVDALWALRDHMMMESARLDNYLSQYN